MGGSQIMKMILGVALSEETPAYVFNIHGATRLPWTGKESPTANLDHRHTACQGASSSIGRIARPCPIGKQGSEPDCNTNTKVM